MCAKDVTADTAIAVDCDANRHGFISKELKQIKNNH
jgi:hypothetical protein